jgi:hypothetical protein
MGRNNGSFLLFLPALPTQATRKAVKAFVREGLSDVGYRGVTLATAVSRCALIRVTDPANGRSELHGIVRIRPAKLAMHAIDALQGRTMFGVPIQVRRYVQRSQLGFGSDERALPRSDRRRQGLKLELIER